MVVKYPAPEMDDVSIVREYQRGDRNKAATALYGKYYGRLFLHSFYIVHSREEAQDLVQDVLGVKFGHNIGTLAESADHGELKLQAWLYRVTKNLSLNTLRDRRRREYLLEAEGASEHHAENYLGRILQGQKRTTVADVMEDLTPDHREILDLRYYHDLSYLELAERLDIKLGTVMSRLSRARERLLEISPDLEDLLEAA